MSGICGIWEPGRTFKASALSSMLEALRVRAGHDEDQQLHAGPACALGVSSRWEFQTASESLGFNVMVDADLVNRGELGAYLGCSTEEALALSSAEIVARLYRKLGVDFLTRLQGAFSIALWDEKQERLILAIDKMGIRSLYWRKEGARLLFGSRLRCVRAAQEEPLRAHSFAILQFLLFASVPAPLTSDANTRKLCPGTYLDVTHRGIIERSYWDLQYHEELRSVEQWSSGLRDELRCAVHRHLESCRQEHTGCFLSGGTDSSSVVAFTSEKLNPTRSFSIAFQEEAFSEIGFARTTARAFSTIHTEKFLNPDDAWRVLDRILEYYDEPFANSSAIGSYCCAELARENGVTTLLAGDGGDELFGGNERYATDKRFALYQAVPNWVRRGLIEPLSRLLPENDGRWGLPRRYIRRANIPNPRRIMSYNFFLSHPATEIFEDSFLAQFKETDWLAVPQAHFDRPTAASELNRILYLDAKMTLADNDIRKVSGTAELAGVNVRYPLLDDRLAEFAGRIPSGLKLRGFEKRFIFKEAMKGILPHAVLYKKKHGFGVPLAQWLLQNPKMLELKNDLTADARTRQRGYFRPAFFDRLTKLHQQQPNFYGEIVWYLLALELWHRSHLDGAREAVHVS
ncbi:MAG TPA: asparagine synthase-related protein [Dongiaceae bacterium]|nr:asparagine synthase-related protein [Dongiaceae bacterium]